MATIPFSVRLILAWQPSCCKFKLENKNVSQTSLSRKQHARPAWFTGPSGSATFSYKLQTASCASDYINKQHFLSEAWFACGGAQRKMSSAMMQTWVFLPFCGSRNEYSPRLFLNQIGAKADGLPSSSKRRVAFFTHTLETPSFLLQPYLADDVRESEKCVSWSCMCCTVSDNEFFSAAADTRYIQQKIATLLKEIEIENRVKKVESCSLGACVRFL